MKPQQRKAMIISLIKEALSMALIIKPGQKPPITWWCNQKLYDDLLISLGYLAAGKDYDHLAFTKLCGIPYKLVQKQPAYLPRSTKKYPYYGSDEVYEATDAIRSHAAMITGPDPDTWNNVAGAMSAPWKKET